MKKVFCTAALAVTLFLSTGRLPSAAFAQTADTSAPTISSFTASATSITATGQTVTLTAAATDNVGVTKVEFYRVGTASTPVLAATDTATPFTFATAVTSASQNGTYIYLSKAYDAAGNATTSAQLSFKINIACTVSCVTPTATLAANVGILKTAATVTITATTTNTSKVEFWGVSSNGTTTHLYTDTTTPFALSFAFSSPTKNAIYTYRVKAFNSSGANVTSADARYAVNLPGLQMDTGFNHACAIKTTGDAVCWGSNKYAQLGNDSDTTPTAPVLVAGGLKFSSISAGERHTCAVQVTTQAIYCWGQNYANALGTNTDVPISGIPVQVASTLKFTSVSAGSYHNCAIATDQSLYCWGRNDYGQLGIGTTTNAKSPTLVSGTRKYLAVSAGAIHTCAIDTSNAAYCWGFNTYGRIGQGTEANSSIPVAVSGGQKFLEIATLDGSSCGLNNVFEVYCWGYGGTGQMGNNTTSSSLVPTKPQTNKIGMLSGGSFQVCATINGVSSYCWGSNTDGQLGINSTTMALTPKLMSGSLKFTTISFGEAHGCGATIDAKVYCWGSNAKKTLASGTLTGSLVPVLITLP